MGGIFISVIHFGISILAYTFAPQYASGLLKQSLSNFGTVFKSIYNQEPIDIGEFLKENGINLAISTGITAGSNFISSQYVAKSELASATGNALNSAAETTTPIASATGNAFKSVGETITFHDSFITN